MYLNDVLKIKIRLILKYYWSNKNYYNYLKNKQMLEK